MKLKITDTPEGFRMLLNNMEISNVQEYTLTNSVDKEPELTVRVLLDKAAVDFTNEESEVK